MIALASLLAAVVAAAPVAPATPPPAAAVSSPAEAPDRERDVRRLLALTGAAELGAQITGPLFEQFRRIMPEVPASIWNEFAREMGKPGEIIDLLAPIYLRHFTADEVRGLIAFYESPLGRAFVAKQPALTLDSMQTGMQWGEATAKRVVERLRERGYRVPGDAT